MRQRHSFSGGVADAPPANLIADNQANSIVNMRMSDGGLLVASPGWAAWAAINTESRYAWTWYPDNLPTGAIDTFVIVHVTTANNVIVSWRISTNGVISVTSSSALGTVTAASTVRVAIRPDQFMFVDGAGNTQARRITINSSHVIQCQNIGAEQPLTFPIIRKIVCDPSTDEEYTGMPIGSILLYSYCIINKYGERSNPSPMQVVDTAGWMIKGNDDDGDYVIDQHNRGSIKYVDIECKIPDRANARAIEIYRSSSEYPESSAPVPAPLLTVVRELGDVDGETVTITDANFPADQTLDYENDQAPSADDICLGGDATFLANTISKRVFAGEITAGYKLTLTNNNAIDYVNQWIQIVLNDGAYAITSQRMIDDTLTLGAKHRFIDSDRITPLTAYYEDCTETGLPNQYDGTKCYAQYVFFVRIPLIPMNSTKTIYLVEFTTVPTMYGGAILPGNIKDMMEYENHVVKNPVRNEWCTLAIGGDRFANVVGHTISDSSNKANTKSAEGIILPLGDVSILTERGLSTGVIGGARMFLFPNCIYPDQSDNGHSCRLIYKFDLSLITTTDQYLFQFPRRLYTVKKVNTNIFISTESETVLGTVLNSHQISNVDTSKLEMFFHYSNVRGTFATPFGVNYTTWKSTLTVYYWSLSTGTLISLVMEDTNYYATPPTEDEGTLSIYENAGTHAGIYFSSKIEGETRFNQVQLMHQLPVFPTTPIGAYGTNTVGAYLYLKNSGITIEEIDLTSDTKTGRIRWSRGGSMPEIQEHYVFDEIVRIFPIRSFVPTDEHNSLLVWTSRGDLLRLALLGESWDQATLIPEQRGIGLSYADAMCGVRDGVIWSSKDKGIYLYTPQGVKPISANRVAADITAMYYLESSNIILMISPTKFRLYDVGRNVFTEESALWTGTIVGTGVVNGDDCLIVNNATAHTLSLLVPSTGTNSASLTTKEYEINGKVIRLTIYGITGEDIEVQPILKGSKFAGGTATLPTYTIGKNTPFAIPNLKGQAVQFNISELTDISYIDLEVSE